MDFTPVLNPVRGPDLRIEDAARRIAKLPLDKPHSIPPAQDTVSLSAEAVALLLTQDMTSASVDVIKTSNGMSKLLLNVTR